MSFYSEIKYFHNVYRESHFDCSTRSQLSANTGPCKSIAYPFMVSHELVEWSKHQ